MNLRPAPERLLLQPPVRFRCNQLRQYGILHPVRQLIPVMQLFAQYPLTLPHEIAQLTHRAFVPKECIFRPVPASLPEAVRGCLADLHTAAFLCMRLIRRHGEQVPLQISPRPEEPLCQDRRSCLLLFQTYTPEDPGYHPPAIFPCLPQEFRVQHPARHNLADHPVDCSII